MDVEWKISQQIGAGIVHGVVSPAFLIRGVLPTEMIRRWGWDGAIIYIYIYIYIYMTAAPVCCYGVATHARGAGCWAVTAK